MVYIIADNVVSPLGMTTMENYQALMAGSSALQHYDHHWGLPEPFTASLFTKEQEQKISIDGLTRFESLAVCSITKALAQTRIDVSSNRIVFILSTTKANIEMLDGGVDVGPASAAQNIANYIGFSTQPIVACNACISGVSAIIMAQRLLELNCYDYAVVCGADVQNKFTVSGFQSLKAVSEETCRPFDIERLGLNLGEAAATIVLQRDYAPDCWGVIKGAVRNDGFHISSPSKDGEGAKLALQAIEAVNFKDEIAFINAHGTATMFNDQMESVAIERAGLSDILVNALKGYFGHTLGAAGIMETVISLQSIKANRILGTKGYEERGVSGKIQLSAVHQTTDKLGFVKMISGFGGCNGAFLVTKGKQDISRKSCTSYLKMHKLRLTSSSLQIDGKTIENNPVNGEWLTYLYKKYVGDYPKFYKMDGLSKLGFLASEMLLDMEEDCKSENRDDRAIVFCNNSSSIGADKKFQESISDLDNFYPSPSVFVYTLPNIVAGEVAIRHKYRGETSFFILNNQDENLMNQIFKATCADEKTRSLLGGWLDYKEESDFIADLFIAQVKR